jgi:hypothetical protein
VVENISGNGKFSWFLHKSSFVVIFVCVNTPPYIKYSNPSQLTIEQIQWGLLTKLSSKVRAGASKYFKEQGDFSEFS